MILRLRKLFIYKLNFIKKHPSFPPSVGRAMTHLIWPAQAYSLHVSASIFLARKSIFYWISRDSNNLFSKQKIIIKNRGE